MYFKFEKAACLLWAKGYQGDSHVNWLWPLFLLAAVYGVV